MSLGSIPESLLNQWPVDSVLYWGLHNVKKPLKINIIWKYIKTLLSSPTSKMKLAACSVQEPEKAA